MVIDQVPGTDSGSFFYLPQHCGIWDFERSINFSYSHRLIFTTLGEMTEADKVMNLQHFGSDPADIRVNPEIWVRIPDHFWLRLDALAEVYAVWAQSSWWQCSWCDPSWLASWPRWSSHHRISVKIKHNFSLFVSLVPSDLLRSSVCFIFLPLFLLVSDLV